RSTRRCSRCSAARAWNAWSAASSSSTAWALSPVRSVARRSRTAPKRSYNPECRPGDRGRREALEESPDTAGQDAGATQAAKADGKWHRKETAGDGSRETSKVRGKRWGKTPPATWRHRAYHNPARGKE